MLFGRKKLAWMAIILFVLFVLNVIAFALLITRGERVEGGTGVVNVILINKPDCTACFNASQYLPQLEALGVTFGKTKVLAATNAQKYLKKYNINRLPAIILSKELKTYPKLVQAWPRIGTVAQDGSFILQGAQPPFYDLKEERVRGIVSLTYLEDGSCTTCYNVTIHKQILQRFGLVIGKEEHVDIKTPAGRALLSAFNITKVPTIIINGEADLYPGFAQVWQSVGRVENQSYIFTNLDAIGGPYKNLQTGEVVNPAQNGGNETTE